MGFYEFMNNIVLVVAEALIIILLYEFFIGAKYFIRQNIIKSTIFSCLYVILVYWARMFIPMGLHSICILLMVTIVLSYLSKIKLYVSALIVAIIMIFSSIIEVIILLVEMPLFKLELDEIMNIPQYKLIHLITFRLIELVFIVLLYHSKIKVFKFNIYRKEASPVAFLTFQIAMIGIFMVSLTYVTSRQTNIILYNSLLLLLYLILIALSIFDYKERERILKVQSKFQAQEEHVRHLETVIDFIRREKHDFANHLNTIHIMGKLRKEDSLDNIINYTTRLTHEIGSSYQFYNTGNDYIDGLLAVKSNVAHEMGITLEVDFEALLSQVEIPDSDLTSIVGNIVDNAFEATSGKPGGEGKVVSISSYVEGDKYYLTIANNGPMIPEKTLERIFESGFSTKTDNKADHGYGLYIVKQMVERNGGEISVSSSEDETVFILDFGVKDSKRLEVV